MEAFGAVEVRAGEVRAVEVRAGEVRVVELTPKRFAPL